MRLQGQHREKQCKQREGLCANVRMWCQHRQEILRLHDQRQEEIGRLQGQMDTLHLQLLKGWRAHLEELERAKVDTWRAKEGGGSESEGGDSADSASEGGLQDRLLFRTSRSR